MDADHGCPAFHQEDNVNTNVAERFKRAVEKSEVAANTVNVMLGNMLRYRGLFALINTAMMTNKRAQIEEALVTITSKPMTDIEADRCLGILRDAGCI
jgi:hypothetical protein